MKKSSNTQTIVEKIEILDESTGQIILKQRTRTINSDNQVNKLILKSQQKIRFFTNLPLDFTMRRR